MRKLQLAITIVVLLGIVIGMNSIVDLQRAKAAEHAKEVEKQREAAEAAARASHDQATETKHEEKAFELPESSGPPSAPVKLEVFVNNTNSCHEANTTLDAVHAVYGPMLRVEWYSMSDAKVAALSDKLEIGCEAGLVINGKIEVEVERNGGKALVAFRGPTNDKYKLRDVYGAINAALREKGHEPPPAAVQKASAL